MEATASAPKVCPACNAHYGEEVAFCSRDGSALVLDVHAGKSDLAGQIIADRYRVVRLLGEGGMGQVYEAQHININKRFAVKLLRPEIVANPEAVARFRQEAWSASSIGHDNIIEIDDFATLPNGSVYLAMEFLEGRALSERMRTPPPLQVDEALDILLQVCRGLEAAHAKNIVHRDMKPENIFLAQKHGRVLVKILDFGIAKVSGAEGAQSLTRTGTIFGTPHYMSPEQALGKPLDHRSDIYSIGVIMYEAFTGRVPFEAESFMGILTKHITAAPMAPRQLAPDRPIPDEIEAVILRAMAKEASDRYQTMTELVEELTRVAALYAPAVLTTPSGTISAQQAAQRSGQMPTAAPSTVRAKLGASGSASLPPDGAASSERSVEGLPSDALDDLEAVQPRRRGLVIGVAVAVIGLGAAALLVLGGRESTPPGALAPPAIVSSPPARPPIAPSVAEPDKSPVAMPSTGSALKDLVILVDSDPVGARITLDGASLGDTPQNITLPGGKSETLVLSKIGYLDQPLILDEKSPTRRIVKLFRMPGKDSRASSSKETAKPGDRPSTPTAIPAPTASLKPTATPVRDTVVTKTAPPLIAAPPTDRRSTPARKGRDPSERVDEPKKGSDIINPY